MLKKMTHCGKYAVAIPAGVVLAVATAHFAKRGWRKLQARRSGELRWPQPLRSHPFHCDYVELMRANINHLWYDLEPAGGLSCLECRHKGEIRFLFAPKGHGLSDCVCRSCFLGMIDPQCSFFGPDELEREKVAAYHAHSVLS